MENAAAVHGVHPSNLGNLFNVNGVPPPSPAVGVTAGRMMMSQQQPPGSNAQVPPTSPSPFVAGDQLAPWTENADAPSNLAPSATENTAPVTSRTLPITEPSSVDEHNLVLARSPAPAPAPASSGRWFSGWFASGSSSKKAEAYPSSGEDGESSNGSVASDDDDGNKEASDDNDDNNDEDEEASDDCDANDGNTKACDDSDADDKEETHDADEASVGEVSIKTASYEEELEEDEDLQNQNPYDIAIKRLKKWAADKFGDSRRLSADSKEYAKDIQNCIQVILAAATKKGSSSVTKTQIKTSLSYKLENLDDVVKKGVKKSMLIKMRAGKGHRVSLHPDLEKLLLGGIVNYPLGLP
jgi:hypothetical protein